MYVRQCFLFGLGGLVLFRCKAVFFFQSLVPRKTLFPFFFFFILPTAPESRGRENSRQVHLWQQCPTKSSGFPSGIKFQLLVMSYKVPQALNAASFFDQISPTFCSWIVPNYWSHFHTNCSHCFLDPESPPQRGSPRPSNLNLAPILPRYYLIISFTAFLP